MKDSISIIFTAIIGTFLIVILPLYSILDRQDSMSYNVVLTETTNFVDDIRNKGFLDKQSYDNYITALATTSNTYKVIIEAYRKTLIHDTDEKGNIIQDSYVEEIELFNTMDILENLDSEFNVDAANSNQKNNVYLFEENDEIYVKVYNTNTTSGSVVYSVLVGAVDNKVIDISYGGIIKNIDWELYDKVAGENIVVPEVIMAVPVNKDNDTNIVQLDSDIAIGNINCKDNDLSIEEVEICDNIGNIGNDYAYVYDLSKEKNKTIKIAIELKDFDKIDIGAGQYKEISQVRNLTDAEKEYIISNYIEVNGMYADKELILRNQDAYYYFDLVLTNVTISSLGYAYSSASITILPGLGQSKDNISSLQAESVEIQLISNEVVNKVYISGPYNWKKVTNSKNINNISTESEVYVNQEIGFVITANLEAQLDNSASEIGQAIRDNLEIYHHEYTNLQVLNGSDFQDIEGIGIHRFVILLKYTESRNVVDNSIKILDDWIADNNGKYLDGGKSKEYRVLVDNLGPEQPKFTISGKLGKNGWYTSDITLTLNQTNDRRYSIVENDATIYSQPIIGGVGIEKTTLNLTGAYTRANSSFKGSLEIKSEGITNATAKSYDYLNNVSSTYTNQIKIDKTAPTEPEVLVMGTSGSNGWFKSNVTLHITPGEDSVSGVNRTTYKVTGANAIAETEGTKYVLTKEGKSTVTVTTYDNAGNKSEKVLQINIEKTEPEAPTIKVIKGTAGENGWYTSDVIVSVILDSSNSASGLSNSTYQITGDTVTEEIVISDNIKEIKLTTNGIHTITVYTRTSAGNLKETTFTVKIDKTAPTETKIVAMGNIGSNGWFKSNVPLDITPGEDSISGVNRTTYKIIGINEEPVTIYAATHILISQNGEYKLIANTYDNAGNNTERIETIKIENTEPKDATFEVIEGTKNSNTNEWYNSNVKVRITLNDANSPSGLKGCTYKITGAQQVAETAITGNNKDVILNSNGVHTITVYTRTVAGNVKTTTFTVKIDKTLPSSPEIKINETASGSLYGVKLYNQNITVNITPGEDSVSAVEKTTYEITGNSGQTIVVRETKGTQFEFSKEGDFTITARTYDKAGNVNEISQAISINKTRPTTPIITEINNKSVLDSTVSNIYGSDNPIKVEVKNVEVGNQLVLEFLNLKTYTKETVVVIAKSEEVVLDVNFEQKGTYKFTVSQTNMYGTTSNESTSTHTYIYQ